MDRFEVDLMIDEAKMLSHCAPIFFLPGSSPEPETIYANGTAGLLDTGHRKLVVTCAHVWTEFETYKATHSEAQLALIFANGQALPEVILPKHLIDIDHDLDLAVFEAQPDDWNMGLKQFYQSTRWPLPRARDRDPITLLGFPGAARRTAPGIAFFNHVPFFSVVTASSDRKLVIDPGAGSRALIDNEGNEMPPIRMGGMSGSPGYVRSYGGSFQLAGFLQMGQTSDAAIFLTHAWFLNRDGTLTRT